MWGVADECDGETESRKPDAHDRLRLSAPEEPGGRPSRWSAAREAAPRRLPTRDSAAGGTTRAAIVRLWYQGRSDTEAESPRKSNDSDN